MSSGALRGGDVQPCEDVDDCKAGRRTTEKHGLSAEESSLLPPVSPEQVTPPKGVANSCSPPAAAKKPRHTHTGPSPTLKPSPASAASKRKRSHVDESDWADSGGYMASKNRKLRAQFAEEFATSGGTDALRGVTCWVNGATTPTREELRVSIGKGGGAFETYMGPAVTHVVCERLATATRVRLQKAVGGRSLKVVTPAWVVDCVREGRKVSEAGYAVDGMTEKGQKSISVFFSGGSGAGGKKKTKIGKGK